MRQKVVVAGGGASGLTAAICAAKAGAQVTLIEQMESTGKKILATGNGRCNYTNDLMDVSCFRGRHPEFCKELIKQYGTKEILDFFESLGIVPKCKGGYYYPYSMQALAVSEALEKGAKHLGVQIFCHEKVLKIHRKNGCFKMMTDRRTLTADAVILSAGGKAAKKLGSDGSGYALAEGLGLKVTEIVPALTGLKCKGRFFKSIAGVRIWAGISVYDDTVSSDISIEERQPLCRDTGELQLTSYGISGIPVFQVSRFAARALNKDHKVRAVIDFMPEFDMERIREMIVRRIALMPYKTAGELLVGWLPQKLIHLFLSASAIDDDAAAKNIPVEKISRLSFVLKHFEMEVTGTNTFDEAQVCAGGVDTEQISPETMMAKWVPGLYVTGELLDIDGMCGGYNLHFAWASGMAAGKAAAKGV